MTNYSLPQVEKVPNMLYYLGEKLWERSHENI